ncbi:MAG: response regulator transcription factor [Proteobacteria bacterium]|nr:response regulator transcription factor [Pseudomonadota bacterium]
MRLLLLEDDAILGEGLRDYLRAEGHVVDWFASLRELQAVDGEPYDVWLLDWHLPDGSGLDWLARRRRAGDATAAFMLTARDRLDDRVLGLDSGADDYLVKPVDPAELAARLRVLQRRQAAPQHAAGTLAVGDAVFDLAARSAAAGGRRVELTAREWALVEALLRRAGRVVAKADLERLLLGADADLQSNALEVHVSSVRRKLGHGVIETLRGLGYRMTANG